MPINANSILFSINLNLQNLKDSHVKAKSLDVDWVFSRKVDLLAPPRADSSRVEVGT